MSTSPRRRPTRRPPMAGLPSTPVFRRRKPGPPDAAHATWWRHAKALFRKPLKTFRLFARVRISQSIYLLFNAAAACAAWYLGNRHATARATGRAISAPRRLHREGFHAGQERQPARRVEG